MSQDYIDQDLNYDVQINVKKFRNPNSPAIKKIFADQMNKFFNTPQEMCEFMTQVGQNHPQGVNFRYLTQLMTHYSTSQALTNLEEKGLLTSQVNDEGEIVYSLTDLGKRITKEL